MSKNAVVSDGKTDPLRPTLVRRIALGCVLVLLGVAFAFLFLKLDPTSSRAGTPEAWIKIKNEKAALSLEKTSFAGQQTDALTYVHQDGSRNDWIRAGSFPLNSPNLTFSIVRQTKAKPLTISLIRNLEDIADLRLVRHTYRPGYYALNTRLGELRGVRFDVNADGIRKYCLGFHKPVSNLVFVKGYVCSPEFSDTDPARVACLVDQIHFIRLTDETALNASIEPGEAKQCGATALEFSNSVADSKGSL
ncbi:hypothetical protein [Nitrobacter sp. TKz-YC02]|uniref:hypothetical protein n=1 Tax=Nitrobacter sp. TKz-YC02 TaxID=3398704 RepID=UPI003CF4FCA4